MEISKPNPHTENLQGHYVKLRAFVRRYGIVTCILLVTGGSVILSVLITALIMALMAPDMADKGTAYIISILCPFVIAPIVSYHLLNMLKYLDDAEQAATLLAHIDPLTQCFNRRYFGELAQYEFLQCLRYGDPFSILMIDADNFKRINDSYGHLAGDEVISFIATQLRSELRASDIGARFGGEEFIILLPKTNLSDAHYQAEKLRIAVAGMPARFDEQTIPVTISIGIATFSQTDDRLEDCIQRADTALLTSKSNGKNQTSSV